ncbi:MAG: C40 family peptidase [Propionibacteriaceae bacterium]|jgi:cell wall-associated NlpC family hydrolase|nr:C40 family peptidase [Propionibacteriaceae bacterium]
MERFFLMHRVAKALLAPLLIVSMAWLGTVPAAADPLSEAQAQLDTLEQESSEAAEAYVEAQVELDAEKDKLTRIQEDIATQEIAVEQARSQLVVVILQQYQDRGASSAAALFGSASADEALVQIQTSQRVGDTTAAIIQDFQLRQSELADLEKSAQASVEAMTAKEAEMESAKAQAEAKVKEAEDLVARLTAEQQAALARARAAAAAAQATAHPQAPPNAGGSSGGASVAPPNGSLAAQVVAYVKARVGYPYVYGGTGPNAYDCSGLTQAAYASIGIHIPRVAGAQVSAGRPVSLSELQPGDLIFVYSPISHVEMYIGGGQKIGAWNPSQGIVQSALWNGMPLTYAVRVL